MTLRGLPAETESRTPPSDPATTSLPGSADPAAGSTVRIGVIGAGAVAELHVAAAATAGVAVTAICDIRPDLATRLAGPGAEVFADPHELFDSGLVDAVIITTPHATHADLATRAARAGLHVLMEKPLATSAADCRRVREASARAGVVLAVGHVLHFLPTLQRAREILRSGELGAPVLILERRAVRYEAGTRPDWFFRRDQAGGGVVMNVGVHAIDKVLWLAGAPATRITAYTAGRADIDVETDAVALVELANGVRASLAITGTGLPGHDDTEVICERGALRLSQTDGLWTSVQGKETRVPVPAPDINAAFAAQLADFAAACAGAGDPAVTGGYGAAVVDIACAWYESATGGTPVAVAATDWMDR